MSKQRGVGVLLAVPMLMLVAGCDTSTKSGSGNPFGIGGGMSGGGIMPMTGGQMPAQQPQSGPIIGEWGVASADGTTGETWEFEPDGSFGVFSYRLRGQAAEVQVTFAGSFKAAASGGDLTLTLTHSTCQLQGGTTSGITYSVSGNQLTVRLPNGQMGVYTKDNVPDENAYQVTTGCFMEDVFTPAMLRAL